LALSSQDYGGIGGERLDASGFECGWGEPGAAAGSALFRPAWGDEGGSAVQDQE